MPELRPLVWFIPERPGRMVTMHACWGADFNGSTAVFPTEADAVDFCRKLWKREPRVDRRGADSAQERDINMELIQHLNVGK